MGRRHDDRERALQLARAINAEITAHNRRAPTESFAIDDNVSCIIANDPDYKPRRKRGAKKSKQPRTNPGVFTVQRIATRLGTTVGALLRERGFEITESDLRTFRWYDDYLRMRFLAESGDALALPRDESFVVSEFSSPQRVLTTKIPKRGELAAGKAPREGDFEITEAEIVGMMNNPTLFAVTVKGRSMADRIRDGDTIVIDTSQRDPRRGDPTAVYVENEGGVLGYWRMEAGRYFLDKHNTEFGPVNLPHPSEFAVLGVVTIVQSRMRRQDRPTARP